MAPTDRIGVLGGTFDPIHLGHLHIAGYARDRLELDAIVFVPTGLPWQKSGTAVSAASHRVRMTELATGARPDFLVSTVDVDRPGPTFTVDTLRDLHAQRPDAQWFFLVGADALATVPTWKDAKRIAELAHLVGVTRPGAPLAAIDFPEARISLLEIPGLDVSSSECRARVRRGEPLTGLVPDLVADYIRDAGLYQD